ILLGGTAGVGFDSGIGGGSAVLQQLLRHETKTGGGDKSAPHPAHARRDGFTLFPSRVRAGAGGSGGLLSCRRVCLRRVFCRRALSGRALGWSAVRWSRRLGLGSCDGQKAAPEQEENFSKNQDCKTAHSNLPTAESWHP